MSIIRCRTPLLPARAAIAAMCAALGGMLGGGAGAGATPGIGAAIAVAALAPALRAQVQETPEAALAALQAGNERHAAGKPLPRPLGEGARRTLASGQWPRAVVLTCADSRVAPEHLFNSGLGELYVVRVEGNVCDPESLASLEFAAEHLGVPLGIVLGHRHCEAVAAAAAAVQGGPAAVTERPATPTLARLLARIHAAVERGRREGLQDDDLARRAERENVHETIAEALRRSPLLRQRVAAGKFRLLPACYELESGRVEWLPERPLEGDGATKPPRRRKPPARNYPPHTALGMLLAGHRRFLSWSGPTGDASLARREGLILGQQPLAIVIACADSRTPPEHLFDLGLGDLYVVRVAGNVVGDEALASLEHAVATTGVSLCVVLGHDGCDALRAAATVNERATFAGASESMRQLLERLEPALEQARGEGGSGDALLRRAADLNVLRTLRQLRARSDLLRQMEEEGQLALVPVAYDLASGDLRWLKDAAAEHPTDPRRLGGEPPDHLPGVDHQRPWRPDPTQLYAAPGPEGAVTSSDLHAGPRAAVAKGDHAAGDRSAMVTVLAALAVAGLGVLAGLLYQRLRR